LWYTRIIPALRRQRQENLKFQANLGYVARPYLQKKKKEREKKRKEYICPYRERGHPSVQPIKLLKDFLS
jgi:hypothetical protein